MSPGLRNFNEPGNLQGFIYTEQPGEIKYIMHMLNVQDCRRQCMMIDLEGPSVLGVKCQHTVLEKSVRTKTPQKVL